MSRDHNPMGREYSKEEIAAAKRIGIGFTATLLAGFREPKKVLSGPIIWATGPWYPEEARKQAAKARKAAADWDLIGDAMDREWKKELPR